MSENKNKLALILLGLFIPYAIDELLASNGAVFTVMIYAYVLFMIFPIYITIDTLDRNQVEAARDLGGSIWKMHTRVVIPLGLSGAFVLTRMQSSANTLLYTVLVSPVPVPAIVLGVTTMIF